MKDQDQTKTYLVAELAAVKRRNAELETLELQSEQAARSRSQAKFHALIENIPGAIYQCADLSRKSVIFVSQAVSDIIGCSTSDSTDIGIHSLFNSIHPEDIQQVEQKVAAALEAQKPFALSYRLIHINGSLKWVHDRGQGVFNEQGDLLYISGVILDMTIGGEKNNSYSHRVVSDVAVNEPAEIALQRSKLRQQARVAPDLIFVMSQDGTYLHYRADNAADLLVPPHQFLGKQVSEVLPANVAEPTLKAIAEVLQTGQSQMFEYELVLNQVARSFEAQLLTYKADEVLIIIQDITDRVRIEDERKQAEKALHKSEAMNQILLNAIPNLMIRMTKDGTYLDFIPAKNFKTIMPDQNMCGKTIFEVMPLEVAQQRMHYVEIALQTGISQVYEYEFQFNQDLYSEEAQVAVSGDDEVLIIVRDIHDRKQMEAERAQVEAALRRREQELQTLLENAPDSIVRFDSDLRYVYINPAAQWAANLSLETIISKTSEKLGFSETSVSRWQTALQSVFETGQAESFETELWTLEGTKHYQSRCVPEFSADGSVQSVLSVTRDITDLKQAELALQHLNQKLDQRVQQRTIELQQANEQLQAEIQERQRVETALRQSEEKFRQLAENIPSVFWVVGRDRKQVIYVSPAYEEISGYSCASLYESSKSWLDAVHPEDRDRALRATASMDISQYDHEYRIIRADGEIRWIHSRAFPIHNQQGEIYRIAGISEDITARKQAEEALRQSEERLRLVLENMPVMLDALDADRKSFIVWNQECERVTGYSADEILGNPNAFALLYPNSIYLEQMMSVWNECGDDFRNWEWEVTCKDGSVKTIAWSTIAKEFSMAGWGAWGVGVDVSDRKKAEAEILKTLERERELNELKSQFISIVSHEFRTPLSTILSSTELLQKYGQEWSEEKKHSRYQRIIEAVDRMTQMLNNVLSIGRTETGKLQFKPAPFNLIKFCSELLQELNLSSNSPHTFKFAHTGCQEVAYLDAQLLHHILMNLLSNAIKYSPHGGDIDLKLFCHSQEVIFQIQDCGIGIPADDQPQLFKVFSRGSNVSTISGTGLGLAIVKQCVNLHGGSIELESELGRGTLFTVKLPLPHSAQNHD